MAAPTRTPSAPEGHNASAADRLVAAYIEPHPAKSGLANYRLKEDEGGYPVWAIIGDLALGTLSPEEVISGFQISRRAFDAVLVFYMRHKQVVDAWIIVNREG